MKKTALIFLFVAYAASVFGVGMKEFYCCGKFVSSKLEFVPTEKHQCGMDTEEKGGCCKTRIQFHKVSDNHAASGSITLAEKQWVFAAMPLPEFNTADLIPLFLPATVNSPHAPPLPGKVPAYIFNCTYRL